MSQERREVGLRRTEFNFGRATSFDMARLPNGQN